MTDVKISGTDYDKYSEIPNKTIQVDGSEVKVITFSYDGGRLHVYINGQEVLADMGIGNDFEVNMEVV